MKRLLIIQHEDDTPPGTTLEWAQLRNYKVEYWYPAKDLNAPVDRNFDLIVICGGGMDTFEEQKFPWLITEKAFLRDIIHRNIRIFGLCLGAQMLAEILGGSVYQHKGWEIGFIPVKTLEGEMLNVFHWHRYTFELPPGAELIVTGDFCKNQAFKYGDTITTTQFHPEATKEWIEECSNSLRDSYEGLVQNKMQILNSMPLQKKLQAWYFSKLDELVNINS
ncbi:MAG: type 1 glutamine amidotransferase [Pseudobdellovibrionaceae bacterium]